MDQPSTSRPKLTAARKIHSHSNKNHHFHCKKNEDLFAKRGNKRKSEDQCSFGNKRRPSGNETLATRRVDCGEKKYSANARLVNYRKALEDKQNQFVKVHTMLNVSSECGVGKPPNNAQASGVNSRLNKYKESALIIDNSVQVDSSGYDEDVEMDWSPVSEEQLLTDINSMRERFSEIVSHKSSLEECITSEIPTNNYIFKDTFIVIDTNIFLSHLYTVENLMDIKLNGVYRPFVLIPWIVVQELDYMKDGRDCKQFLQTSARRAVDFINKSLRNHNNTLKGQSVLDAAEHCIHSKNADDGILACCMQVLERGNRAILLSNDKNLRNKALIHSIPAYSAEEIFKELGVSPPSKNVNEPNKSDEVKSHLTTLLSTIIHGEALSAYGEYYYKMGVLKDAPWNLEQCLVKFEKLWIAVFSEKLPKHFLQNVQDFRKFLKGSRDHKTLVEFALSVCVHLKNSLNDYRKLTVDCIDKIARLK